MTAAHEILTKAAGHMQDRASTYDKPEGERSMAQTVAIFNLYHSTELTEAQGWHLLQILKDVRLFTRPGYHADSAEDCVAYAALKAEALIHADVIARALGNRQDVDLAGSTGIPVDHEPAVLANVAAFSSNWQEVRDAARMVVEMDGEPNEQRRQDAAAEDEAFARIEPYTGQGGVMIRCPGCVALSCECRP